ncbi:MAG: DUF1573 domain-containing protein [Verrucomicrobia bacterium]|nr:DUF1573 domain-containing protein [Verrucomicrobiota bacterium]MBV9299966.1 DUF1573 domain-containing protein [Verrucomicrobiota bacterium]
MKLLLFILFVFAGSAFGQLTWETTERTFNSKPEDKEVIAKYKFTNTGAETVKIQNVRTSCGCTTAALNKSDYAPGESGEIEAKFTFSGRTGRQEKSIIVTTTARPEQPTMLRLHVYIQETVKIEPQFVLWQLGEEPAPKVIHIAVAQDAAAKIVSVTSDNPALKVKLTELKPGKVYEVQITPDSATKPAAATLMIRTDYPPDNPETRYAYARVK